MNHQEKARACALKTSIGGQALMEGIMMRGPKKTALAVRNTKGEIVVEEFETKGVKRPKICRWPFIRGIFAYIDSMTVGYRALMRSAELSGLEDIVEESPKKKKKREAAEKQASETEQTACAESSEAPLAEAVQADAAATETPEQENKDEEKLPAWVVSVMMIVSVVVAMAACLFLFKWLPIQLFSWLTIPFPFLQETGSTIADSLIKSAFEGIVKIFLLVGYMSLISLMKDIRRTFMYHGAEHKTIFCYEAGLELTVENVRRQRCFHPRCGTSFLIVMLLVNIFVSFFIDPVTLLIWGMKLDVWARSLVSLALLPFIVGVGYELIKIAGRHDNLFTRIISAPGLLLQHITVFEPTDDMIECAILAVKEVIPDDGSDKW